MNAYSNPERCAAFMQHLEDNHDRIQLLRKQMKCPGHSMVDRVMAFTELYNLMHGDPYAQRRLVTELSIEAEKEKAHHGNHPH